MTQPSLKRKREVKNICCIGAGYVGGPSAAVIANKAPHLNVTVVDIDARRIEAWNSETLPVYEPNLYQLVKPARDGTETRRPNLFFSTKIDEKIREADVVFIGVNTPTKRTGLGAGKASDLGWLEAATRRVAKAAEKDTIVVEKSTVPCGTAESMREILMANAQPGVHFEVLSNPEFLAEGTAIKNLLHPDRILIGSLDTEAGYSAAESLVDVYANWIPREKLITMNLWSSELAKLAANAMLAQRISSINAFSSICEAVSANIQDVAYAVGLDSRIGPKMMNASVGFGGSCFKKDILNLVYISESLNLPEVAAYWHSVIAINEYQKDRFVRRIVKAMHSTLYQKKIAILGFAYKKDTGDTRESAAIDVVTALLAENATIHIFDHNPYDACQDAHGVVILTEWDMFSNKNVKVGPSSANPLLNVTNKQLNGSMATSPRRRTARMGPCRPAAHTMMVANIMDKPMYVFDGRNTIDVGALEQLGFQVEAIGVASAASIAMAK
ncbi:UDP-glucose 6-dehydrogenase 1 [Cyphellophora attinorum]|uniref:UDP-glucose 6-dehydrogenase n=1 Tax=Cyphellophora attinorum TaxID=1664694 RepID=A0A0N1H2N9_9EURO|nr:UDP-glucose 6-dehydrogenase 1 [Phialophora attinorum]KPI34705.1 UDP-glucose 6-dehydrogenase 1 [Phialophora attinorum]